MKTPYGHHKEPFSRTSESRSSSISLACRANTPLGLAPPAAMPHTVSPFEHGQPAQTLPEWLQPLQQVRLVGSSPLPEALHPFLHPRVSAAFRLAANGGEGDSWRAGVLPCHLELYRQRCLQGISLLNQLLHQTPEEQQSNSALKHETRTFAPSAAQA